MTDIRARVADGATIANGWSLLPSLIGFEAYAGLGWDSVTIDMQHGWWDYDSILGALIALDGLGVASLVRAPWNEPGILGKLLDAGAGGLICPMINTREDAEALARACRYPPVGERSFGPVRGRWRPALRGDQAGADREPLILPQVETELAVRNIRDILDTPGISGVYVGPGDLGLSMGLSPVLDREEPAILGMYQVVIDACRRRGSIAAVHAASVDYARRMTDLGFGLVTVGSDVGHLLGAGSQALASFHAEPASRIDTY